MPIFLPPAVAPQQATPAELAQAPSAARVLQIKGLRLHLIGTDGISATELREALQLAQTPSDLVIRMARLVYLRVSPAERVDYAMVGSDLYVICVPQRIGRVTGTPALRPFFEDLEGRTAPDARRLEEDRALAELYAKRAALDGSLKMRPAEDNTVALDVLAADNGDNRMHAAADYSNAGNRFVGRNLAGVDLRYDTRSADEYHLTFKHAFGGQSATASAGHYDEAQGGWSGISRGGVWQAVGHGFVYSQELPAGRLDGQFAEGNLSWTGVIYADWNRRSLLQLRGSYADRSSTAMGTTVFAERYADLEPSLNYSTLHVFDSSRLTLDASLAAIAGSLIGDTRLTAAARQIGLGRASLHPQWKFDGWGTVGFNLYGQYSARSVPEELQLVLGGPAALAGYLPGAIYGDSGAVGRFAWEQQLLDGGRFELKGRLYAEYGTARLHDATAAAAGSHGADAGGGITAEAYKRLTVSLDLAHGFSRSAATADVPGVYATVSLHN